MRFSPLFSVGLLVGLSGAGSLGLAGCTTTDVAPEVPCGTYATVRLCHGKTLMCPTEHTALQLADGTRLLPNGPAWTAYQPHQVDGQVLLVGYTLGDTLPANEPGNVRATITCLELPEQLCTIPLVP